MQNGLLLIDKPNGLRSTECVARIKRIFGRGTRVGHAGTLDSTASGLLIVLLGTATRLSDYVMKLPKTYEALVKLGRATDTCDYSGQTVFSGDATRVDESAFDRVLCSFWGERMQYPPEISALKVNGKASHRLVRAGEKPNLAARSVAMTSVRRCSPLSDGVVRISVTCGKGTYIRSIVRDIGERLGCGAHVAELRRLSIGPFRVSDACAPDELYGSAERRVRSFWEVGIFFHRISLTEEAERKLLNGLSVSMSEAGRYVPGIVGLKNGLCVEGAKMIGFADMIDDGGATQLKPKANIEAKPEGKAKA